MGKGSILGHDGSGVCFGSLRVLLLGPAALNQQRQEEDHVSGEHREKNFLETLTTMLLGSYRYLRGTRDPKWIGHVHNLFPSRINPRYMRD